MKKSVFLAVVVVMCLAMVFGICEFSFSQTQWKPCYTAYVFDTSGSMVNYGFDQAKEALLGELEDLRERDIGFIVPFAENELTTKRVTYADVCQDIEDVKMFVSGLSATGKFTNLDEGVDSGILALLDEPGEAILTLTLLSDCTPDPGPNHKKMQLTELSDRIPSRIMFYVIDLSQREYPGFIAENIAGFRSYTKAGINLTVFPVNVARLPELLSLLKPSFETVGVEDELGNGSWRWYGLVILAVIIPVAVIILRQRPRTINFGDIQAEAVNVETPDGQEGEAEEDSDGHTQIQMLSVKIGDDQRRFPAPVTFTIGGGKSDDVWVQGGKLRELRISSDDDTCIFRQRTGFLRKSKGPIFRSREFMLSTGISVSVSLQLDRTEHRYIK